MRLLARCSKACEYVCSVIHWCKHFATPWTVACQTPLSMGFPRKKYWNGFPSPGDLPDEGIESVSLALNLSRDWNCVFCVSCIGRHILYNWAMWEAKDKLNHALFYTITYITRDTKIKQKSSNVINEFIWQ